MRSARCARAVAGCAVLGLGVLAGCGSPDITTSPVSTTSARAGARSSTAAPSSAPGSTAGTAAPQRAAVGDALGLTGFQPDERMTVTVTQVVDPATPTSAGLAPSPGHRLVAVQFRLLNTGTAVYSDAPSNGATLIDSQGQGFNALAYAPTTAGPAFPAGVHLAQGESALGFISFDLPAGSSPAKVQFTLESGLAAQTGQWTVTGGSGGSGAPAASAAGTATPAAPSTPARTTATTTATAVPTDPGQVVRDYYAAINAHDYARAWALGGRNLSPSFAAFGAGFADTASDALTVTGVHGNTVEVTLDATARDGSHRHFAGSYTVVDGVITGASIR
ncbi:hypothetical protein AB0K43_30505 [Kitasatospora sp. NPDC049258]|uniref:hypothetical protein n=1 Tax=Kitasatospora sp. NPDC049258 TaxID=3155394 RepID=UPI003422F2E2